MPKYWGGNYFAHGEEEEERLNNGENNGQATHGARKHAWRTQAAWAKSLILWTLDKILSEQCGVSGHIYII